MNTEIDVVDKRIWPDPILNLLMSNYFGSPIDKQRKNLQSAAAQAHWRFVLQQERLLGKELKGTKEEFVASHCLNKPKLFDFWLFFSGWMQGDKQARKWPPSYRQRLHWG
jgi:hypothetical protein